MKKKWIGYLGLISLLFLPSPQLFSEIGIKTGMSLSFARKNRIIYNPTALFAPKAGIFYSLQIGDFFSIQPELNYVRKGNRYYCVNCRAYRVANLDYLEIPIVINLHLLDKTLDLFSGVYVGILLDSIKIDDQHVWTWRDNRIRKTDYGVSFGARYRLFKFVLVELQFNQGLIGVVHEPNQAVTKGHKNKTFSLLIGFGF